MTDLRFARRLQEEAAAKWIATWAHLDAGDVDRFREAWRELTALGLDAVWAAENPSVGERLMVRRALELASREADTGEHRRMT